MEPTENSYDVRPFLSFANRRKSRNFLFTSTDLEELDLRNEVPVDFVLVAPSGADQCPVEEDGWNPRHAFEEEIKKVGLFVEVDNIDELSFVKINAPENVLRKYCGIMKLRMPIKKSIENYFEKENISDDHRTRFSSIFKYIFKTNIVESTILTAEYSIETSCLFDEDDPDFFTDEVRMLVIDFILNRINWGREKDDPNTVGLQRLIDKGVYKAAYPLHDGDCDFEESCRYELLTNWASINKCLHKQPIDQIKEYLGVKYAFYFAWLGFYTSMLIPAAILGVVVFLYGIITLPSNRLSNDICNATDVIMCPLCDDNSDNECTFWKLSEACSYSKLLYIFDNKLTVVYAFLMSIWATIFLEMWKRYASVITHHWGLTHFNLDSEYPRPKYLTKLSHSDHTINLVTGEIEPVVPFWKKISVLFISYSILLLTLMIAIVPVFVVIMYRMAMLSVDFFNTYALMSGYRRHLFISITAGFFNLFCIQLLNYLYGKIAVYLTEIELPRTQHEFDEILKIKIYVFKFINSYTSIIYIAFWKGKYIGYPGDYIRIFNFRQEECSPGGCLVDISIQLFIIMVGQQALNAFVEMLFPACLKWYNSLNGTYVRFKRQESSSKIIRVKEAEDEKPWLNDYQLLDLGPLGLLPEYLEMVLQYGFVTLFVTALPLSALFALINNVLELRLDGKKFLKYYRRPIPHRVPDIGVWYRVLDIIGVISVVTNAIIIAFNSNFLPIFLYTTYVNENHTDEGFLNYSLAYFPVNDLSRNISKNSSFGNITECRYQDYRSGKEDDYIRTPFYYQLLVTRLLFVVLFQNIVSFIKIIIQWLIPDMPKSVKDRIKRESYLIAQMTIDQ